MSKTSKTNSPAVAAAQVAEAEKAGAAKKAAQEQASAEAAQQAAAKEAADKSAADAKAKEDADAAKKAAQEQASAEAAAMQLRGKSITITAKPREGFWRCGIHHSPVGTPHPASDFTAEQWETLRTEPNLIVEG